jgi:hypothetical protein
MKGIYEFYKDCLELQPRVSTEIRSILDAGEALTRGHSEIMDRCAEEFRLALTANDGDYALLLRALDAFFCAQGGAALSFDDVRSSIYEMPFYPIAEHLIYVFPYGQKRLQSILSGCQEALAARPRPVRVIDVGVGSGVIARCLLSSREPEIALDILDVSEACLRYATRVIGPRSHSLISQNFLEYAPAERYDLAVASEVVEHVEDPLAALNSLSALLSEDGTLILGVPIALPMTMHLTVFQSVEEVVGLAHSAGLVLQEGWLYPLYGGSLDLTLCLRSR